MTSFFGAAPTQALVPSNQQVIVQQQQSVQSLQDILNSTTALTASVSGPELFGDDCDRVVAQLNQLLASLGVGQGYYSAGQQPFVYTPNNIFYRLKAVGYNRLSKHKNAHGLVSLILASSPSNFKTDQGQMKIVHDLGAILRSSKQPAPMLGLIQQQQQPVKPSLRVEIKSINAHDEQNTEVVILAKESGRIIPALDLYNELMQKANELQQQLLCKKIAPRVEIDPANLENYLRRPPAGYEEIWLQAIRENPDPVNLIPYPIQGFRELSQRKKMQTSLVQSLHAEVDDNFNRLNGFHRNIIEAKNKYIQIIQKQKSLSNRLLQVLVMQANNQRHGQIVDEKEEQLQSRLERMNFLLNGPEKLKEQVTTIFETIRRDGSKLEQSAKENVQTGLNISQKEMAEVRRCLFTRQQLVENLVSIVKQSVDVLRVVEEAKSGSLKSI
uniref:Nucleoporin Nup54 alpha-helical domain-containing protein n=1 Tax=Meloidogyne incognita TaxID=6306 RepID=A0A914NM65_MELIC